ncbi:MAG: hypothetical protein V3U79_06550 [Dehalococcoidia bacterium]
MSIEPAKGFHFEFSYPGYLQRSGSQNVISLQEDVMNLTAVSRRPIGLTRKVGGRFGERVELRWKSYTLLMGRMEAWAVTPHSRTSRAAASKVEPADPFQAWEESKPYVTSSLPILEAAKYASLQGEEPRIREAPVDESTGREALRLAAYALEKTGQLLNGFSLAGVMVLSLLAAFPGSATPLFPGSPRQGR